MGRTLKRVALDFTWPTGKVWEGFINQHYKKCPEQDKTCFNGSNAAAVYLEHLANMFAVVADSASRGHTHPYCDTLPYGSSHPRWEIQPQEIRKKFTEVVDKLGAERGAFGYSNRGSDIFFKLLDVAGIKNTHEEKNPAYEWTHCPVCKGEGLDPAVKEKYDAWTETEPPAGPGYQLWETTSEGSPVSPVFKTLDELCAWCEKHATTFADNKTSAANWKKMLEKDFVTHTEGNMTFI